MISAVLLLTVTVSVVSVFAGWAPNLVQGITDQTGNQTRNQVSCNEADLEIVSAKYFIGTDTTVVVRNNGRKSLDRVMVEAWRDERPLNRTEISMDIGALKTVNVTTNSEPDRVEAIAVACDEAYDRLVEIS